MVADLEEHERLVEVARAWVREQACRLIGGPLSANVTECPSCGDRIISLDRPATYSLDHGQHVCKACRAERDLTLMTFPETDIGGEGA